MISRNPQGDGGGSSPADPPADPPPPAPPNRPSASGQAPVVPGPATVARGTATPPSAAMTPGVAASTTTPPPVGAAAPTAASGSDSSAPGTNAPTPAITAPAVPAGRATVTPVAGASTLTSPGVRTAAANITTQTGAGFAAVGAAPTAAAATATAAAPATATAAAAAAHAAAAAPQVASAGGGEGPQRGTVYGGPPDSDDSLPSQDGPSGRLTQLRIGSHTATKAALAQLSLSPRHSGLILGSDRYQRPVSIRCFRPEPTRLGLVGSVAVGKLLTFRALALGSRVVVVSSDPAAWERFGEPATGVPSRLMVYPDERPLTLTNTAQEPALVVYDLGAAGATLPPPLGPWQTQLTILRTLDQAGAPALQECHLVMLQRLSVSEADIARSALRLSDPQLRQVRTMADSLLALHGSGADQYVWLAQTEIEQAHIGSLSR